VSDDPQPTDEHSEIDEPALAASDDAPEPADQAGAGAGSPSPDDLDLDRIDADLAGVERALSRLDDGSYWTDETTGEPIDPDVLDADPTSTRNAPGSAAASV